MKLSTKIITVSFATLFSISAFGFDRMIENRSIIVETNPMSAKEINAFEKSFGNFEKETFKFLRIEQVQRVEEHYHTKPKIQYTPQNFKSNSDSFGQW